METNSNIISILISLVGSAATIVGAVYGIKAYLVTKDIFYKGIQIDTNKVLTQVGLELTMTFIIPFRNFQSATEKIWNDPHFDEQSVLYVKEVLKKSMFEPHFLYYEQHRGEIWNAVANCTEGQADSFKALRNFVEKAKAFDRGMNDLKENLDKYIDEKDKDKDRRNDTMNDFFNMNTHINKGIFDKGLKLMNEIDQCIKDLPPELSVKEISNALR